VFWLHFCFFCEEKSNEVFSSKEILVFFFTKRFIRSTSSLPALAEAEGEKKLPPRSSPPSSSAAAA